MNLETTVAWVHKYTEVVTVCALNESSDLLVFYASFRKEFKRLWK